MCNIFQVQLRLGLLIATFGLVVSCLITNCPRGGKRAENTEENPIAYPAPHQCAPCGPEGEGVCLGSNICCGKEFGCLTSSRYTKPCRSIRSLQMACLAELSAPSCGGKGRCKAKYVCCSKDQCVMDSTCKSGKYKDLSEPSISANNLHGFWPLQQKMSAPKGGETNQDGSNDVSTLWKNDFTSLASDYDK